MTNNHLNITISGFMRQKMLVLLSVVSMALVLTLLRLTNPAAGETDYPHGPKSGAVAPPENKGYSGPAYQNQGRLRL